MVLMLRTEMVHGIISYTSHNKWVEKKVEPFFMIMLSLEVILKLYIC